MNVETNSRCCFGGCPTRSGTVAASIFLICASAINVICSWTEWTQNQSNYGVSLMTLLTIIFASLSIWAFQAKKFWPCVGMIVILVLNIISSIAILAVAGATLAASCDPYEADCNAIRKAAAALRVIYLIVLAVCVWFIYIYVKAIEFIKTEQRVGLPTQIGGGIPTAAYVVNQQMQPPPPYQQPQVYVVPPTA